MLQRPAGNMPFNAMATHLVIPLFQPSRRLTPEAWERVLVIRHKFIGDTILLSPFLHQLKSLLPPTTQIDMVVAKGSGELLEGHPAVHQLIYTHTPQYQAILKARHYDAAFILKRSWSSLLMALKANIPVRIGFATEGRSAWLTHPISYPNVQAHEADAFMACLNPLLPPHEMPPTAHMAPWQHWEASLPPKLTQALNTYQQEGRLCMLIHACASNPAKAWPLKHWHTLLDLLSTAIPHLRQPLALIAIGTRSDSETYEALRPSISASLPFHNLCGTLSLPQSGALMSHITLALGVDSGPMHLAAAGGASTISLFGPMDSTRWKPLPVQGNTDQRTEVVQLQLPCQPCQLKQPCPFNIACLQHLQPHQVWESLSKALGMGSIT